MFCLLPILFLVSKEKNFHPYEADDFYTGDPNICSVVYDAIEDAKTNKSKIYLDNTYKKSCNSKKPPNLMPQNKRQKNTYKKDAISPYRGTFGANTGPTLTFPSIGPILQFYTDRSNSLMLAIDEIVTASLTNLVNSANDLTTTIKANIDAPFNSDLNALRSEIVALFDAVTITINTGITNVYMSAKTSLRENLSASDALLLNQITLDLDALKTLITNKTNTYIANATTQINNYITTANMNVLTQITSILQNTSNTDPILPQLTFLSVNDIKEIIDSVFSTFAADLTTAINNFLTGVNTILRSETSALISGQTTILNTSEQNVTQVITLAVTTLLGDLEDVFFASSSEMTANIAAVINSALPAYQSALTAIINSLESDISSLIQNSATAATTQVNTILDSNMDFLTNQVSTIFRTTV